MKTQIQLNNSTIPGSSKFSVYSYFKNPVLARNSFDLKNSRIKQFRLNSYDDELCYPIGEVFTAKEVMSTDIPTCYADTTIIQALKILVDFQTTGLPVVNQSNEIVGIVSDYDLLAINELRLEESMFPKADQDWQGFFQLQKILEKRSAKAVGDVMSQPVTVAPDTCLTQCVDWLLLKNLRRLPVVDEDGVLLGMIERSNLIEAALKAKNEEAESSIFV